MRIFKFISAGIPDGNHIKNAVQLAKEHCADMTINEKKCFGEGKHQTMITVDGKNNVIIYLLEEKNEI